MNDFIAGWRRRSAMMLDHAGCPPWLIWLRCKPGFINGMLWGDLLYLLTGGDNG